ncbi:Sir2 family NAD+-dependent deacetylase [Kistimonas asteriae]|uniref:Sir2 family NAD+-dependent deacetylase n=1 Tax=Kistimonas asteriae TaxID=517724 RepID=UPI001BACDD1E|nr:Sir2 family NAD+-dependent deacetylase [Kistimonas asteriae]
MVGYHSVVVLTGAGISAESGLRTFRASDGLWEDHRIEDVATPEGFVRNPALVQDFYNQRRRQLACVEPNAAHRALAEFEQRFDGRFLLVTQNVDDLHERAGSKNLLHMHGELRMARCVVTGEVEPQDGDILPESRCRCCGAPGNLRPHIVWFNEMPLYMDTIYEALADCDLFVAIGTSGNVYPAAGFVLEAKQNGAKTILLNLDEADNSSLYDQQLMSAATVTVPLLINQILS